MLISIQITLHNKKYIKKDIERIMFDFAGETSQRETFIDGFRFVVKGIKR